MPFDVVILATGYTTNIDYLEDEVKRILEYNPDDRFMPIVAYKSTMHPDLPGLACVGLNTGPTFIGMES